MAISNLLAALEREADAERAAIAAAAAADADRVRADAARRNAIDRQATIADVRADQTRRAEAELAGAARRWRGEVLTARGAALDRLYAAVVAALPAQLAGERGARLLETLVAAALAALPDGVVATARCPTALVGAVRRQLAARPHLTVVGDDAAGSGVRVEVEGGLVIDATLEAQLARRWPRLRQSALSPRPEGVP